jgi:MarR family transcriptional regulator, organic hydroperoxide resistance regulator
MKPEETIDFHIRSLWHTISRLYNEEAAKYGSTMSTGFVLLNIDADCGTPSTSLGPRMGMESTSLTRILKTMEEKNLIYRKPNPDDGRGVLICLTEFGKEMRNVSRDVVVRFNQKIQAELNVEELQGFFSVMKKIQDTIQELKMINPIWKEE